MISFLHNRNGEGMSISVLVMILFFRLSLGFFRLAVCVSGWTQTAMTSWSNVAQICKGLIVTVKLISMGIEPE